MNLLLPLHTKYRPEFLENMIGNKAIKNTLESIFSRKTGLPHAFLFIGPTGCGKTTFSRIIKNHLGCSDYDYAEFNVANVRGIDTIREIAMNCQLAPLDGKSRVFLLDEAAKLTNDAQHALLKLLEDPPSHVFFVLATTDPGKLLSTVRNRCIIMQVGKLTKIEIIELLKFVIEKENASLPPEAIQEIARISDGCPRQALVILDSVIDIEDDQKLLESVQTFTPKESSIIEICRILVDKKQGKKWNLIADILKNLDDDPETIRVAILNYLNTILLNGGQNTVIAHTMTFFLDSFFNSGKAGLSLALYTACTTLQSG